MLAPGSEAEACELIERVFMEFVAPGYSQRGVDEFMSYVNAARMAERRTQNHFAVAAHCAGRIIGVIEIRGNEHVSLMFVDKEHHGRGVCRTLFDNAVDHIRAAGRAPSAMTVNSSPFAAPVYVRLGFSVQEPEKEINGIRFIPMKMEL
jgi:GNAT superfamily N-acetyltransferase